LTVTAGAIFNGPVTINGGDLSTSGAFYGTTANLREITVRQDLNVANKTTSDSIQTNSLAVAGDTTTNNLTVFNNADFRKSISVTDTVAADHVQAQAVDTINLNASIASISNELWFWEHADARIIAKVDDDHMITLTFVTDDLEMQLVSIGPERLEKGMTTAIKFDEETHFKGNLIFDNELLIDTIQLKTLRVKEYMWVNRNYTGGEVTPSYPTQITIEGTKPVAFGSPTHTFLYLNLVGFKWTAEIEYYGAMPEPKTTIKMFEIDRSNDEKSFNMDFNGDIQPHSLTLKGNEQKLKFVNTDWAWYHQLVDEKYYFRNSNNLGLLDLEVYQIYKDNGKYHMKFNGKIEADNISNMTVTHKTEVSEPEVGRFCETTGEITSLEQIGITDCICKVKVATTLSNKIMGIITAGGSFASPGDVLVVVDDGEYHLGDLLVPTETGARVATDDDKLFIMLNGLPKVRVTSVDANVLPKINNKVCVACFIR
jgi:hypothetical protein